MNQEPHDYSEYKENTNHFLEIITAQAIFDILNEPEVDRCIENIAKQDIQVYGNLSHDKTIALQDVSENFSEPDL